MRHRLLAVASVAALVASLGATAGTEQAPDSPSFDAASIKPNKSGDGKVALFFQPGGRFNAIGVTLKMLIGAAYATPAPLPDYQIVGGPDWMGSDRFDVVAKAAGDPQPGPQGPPPIMFEMLRRLLKERFHLEVHNESRELPVYSMVTSRTDKKLGAKVSPAAVDCAALRGARGSAPPAGPPPVPTGFDRPQCGIRIAPGTMLAGSVTMEQLASAFSRLPIVARPVFNRTEVTGNFDLELKWTPPQIPAAAPPGAPPLPPIDPDGPSFFTAVQEQLGLKLESIKGPVDVVVIDRADHPTED
jgi:bla regulator protein blaR1